VEGPLGSSIRSCGSVLLKQRREDPVALDHLNIVRQGGQWALHFGYEDQMLRVHACPVLERGHPFAHQLCDDLADVCRSSWTMQALAVADQQSIPFQRGRDKVPFMIGPEASGAAPVAIEESQERD